MARSLLETVAREYIKAQKQQQAQKVREAKEAERMAKRAEIESKKIAAAQERQRKAEEKVRLQIAAEQSKLAMLNASIEDRYGMAAERHRQISALLTNWDRKDPEMVIDLCKEDIELAPLLYDYATRRAIANHTPITFPHIDSYFILCAVYQSIGKYDHAILACQQAQEMGIIQTPFGGPMDKYIQALKKMKMEIQNNGKV